MNLPLRCLLVEDSENDAELMLDRLRAGGFDVSAERVDDADAMRAALDRQSWDIVIADYRMPGFTGMTALALARERDGELPFIMLSGQMGEEQAVEAMRAGANDYLSKDHIQRLAPAVQRALKEASARRAHRQVAVALEASEAQLRFVTDHMPTMIAHCDPQRRYKFVNLPYAQLFGRLPADLLGKHMRELVGEAVYAEADPSIVSVLTGQRVEHDVELRESTGSRQTLRAIYEPELDADGQVVGFVVALVDISARKLAEDLLLASNQRLQATLDASPDLIFEIGLDGRYYDYHSPHTDLLAPAPGSLLGKLVTDVLPAEAADTVMAALRDADENQTSTGKQIQLTLAGSVKWFELSVARKATTNDDSPRFVVLSRDITTRKQSEAADAFLAQAGIDPDGEPFFAALACFLATSLQVEYICIDRLEGDRLTASTLAVWRDGEFQDNLRYALSDTPCGQLAGQNVCCYPANVCALFPADTALRELRAESYVGIALQNHNGCAIGLIAAIGRRPLKDPTGAESLLTRVAPRAAAELERLSMETALRESEARFRSLFEQAPLGAALVDSRTGAVLEVNERFADIAGHAVSDLTRMDWNSMIHPDDLGAGLAQRARMQGGQIAGFEMDQRLRQPDGGYKWIHITVAQVLRGADGETRQLCMIQDISERKEADDAMRASHAVLSQFNALAVGRELRMVELKLEVNELCAKLGEPPRHRIVAKLPAREGPAR